MTKCARLPAHVFPAGLTPGPGLPAGMRVEVELTVVEVAPAGVVPEGMLPVGAPAAVSVAPAGLPREWERWWSERAGARAERGRPTLSLRSQPSVPLPATQRPPM